VVPGVSGIPELVIHGKTGLLVPPGDPVALADAATRLLSQPKLAAAMAEAARLRVEKVFDHDRLLPELARIYRQRIKEVMK
jgi:glycosyltransferase involved in cell wall biosynthesis